MDWHGLELAASDGELGDGDYIPSNVREWNNFREQYEKAMQIYDGWPKTDPSYPGITAEEAMDLDHKIQFCGHGYKKSVRECADNIVTQSIGNKKFQEYGVDFKKYNAVTEMLQSIRNGFSVSAFSYRKKMLFPRCTVGSVTINVLNSRNLTFCHPIDYVGMDVRITSGAEDSNLSSLLGFPKHVVGDVYFLEVPKLRSLANIGKVDGKIYIGDGHTLTTVDPSTLKESIIVLSYDRFVKKL